MYTGNAQWAGGPHYILLKREALSRGEAVRKLTSREGFNIHGPIQPDPARSNSPQFTSLDRDSKHSEDIEYVLSHWAG